MAMHRCDFDPKHKPLCPKTTIHPETKSPPSLSNIGKKKDAPKARRKSTGREPKNRFASGKRPASPSPTTKRRDVAQGGRTRHSKS